MFAAASVDFGKAERHFGFGRVSWATRWHEGRDPLTGEDFIEFADDGRIRRIVSFNGSPGLP